MQRVFLEIVGKLGAMRVWLRSRCAVDVDSKLTRDPTLADLMTVLLALLEDVGYVFQGHKDGMWQDHQRFDSSLGYSIPPGTIISIRPCFSSLESRADPVVLNNWPHTSHGAFEPRRRHLEHVLAIK